MKEGPELKKKLSEVEAKQNRWLGRRVEAHDAKDNPIPEGEEVMPLEKGLEQLPVGPKEGPSSQGGEESFESFERQKVIKSQIDKFQPNIKRMESSIDDLKRQVKEAQDSKDELSKGPQPLKVLAEKHFHPDGKYDLAELFSPPRMTVMTDKFGLKGGWSIDDQVEDPVTKRTYDLRKAKDQNEVRRMVRRDKPLVITVSPPCTVFSIANQGPIDQKELAGAIEMMKFATEMCELQRREGRYYVFEQPQGSRAWDLGVVKEMMAKQDSGITTMHQCMYGLKTTDAEGEGMACTPTKVITNHDTLAEALSRKCNGAHRHVHLVGKAACTRAAQYPKDMCQEVLKAVAVIKKNKDELQVLCVEREDMCEEDNYGEDVAGDEYRDYYYEGLRDSTTGN